MKLCFVHPPLDGPVSGGNRYNAALIGAARHLGLALRACAWHPDTAPPEPAADETLLWDSLFLPELARRNLAVGQRQGLLLHYLPFHDPLLDENERRRWRDIVDRALAGMDFHIATGARVAAALRQYRPGRPTWLCEPGVDAAFLSARAQSPARRQTGPVRLLTVASLLPAKRQRELLDLLHGIDGDWVWHLAGDERPCPDYARRLWRRAAELGLAGRIRRHGALTSAALARLMAGMDLCVQYSAYESYGMALAEALAAGLPAIATDVGAAARLVRHGETGWLTAADDTEGFRAALAGLIGDRDRLRHYRMAAGRDEPVAAAWRFPALFRQLALETRGPA